MLDRLDGLLPVALATLLLLMAGLWTPSAPDDRGVAVDMVDNDMGNQSQ